ncbi:hypothetical protein AMTRI_Chr03g56440 [Amborella trichopoda]
MYNGMMDPELLRLAQEQMSRISPDELAKLQQQMMANPELMRLASESMKNMRPEDLRSAAEQLKDTRTEDMMDIGEKIAKATPEEIEAMRAHADAKISYELNGAEMLKKQGNDLHAQGLYKEAAQKYLLAKTNLKDVPFSKARTLRMACSLNLMSCYLRSSQYEDCIKEGSEVLAYDAGNVKALYRRGQAYRELGKLQAAVKDLSKANTISPADETIAEVLRAVKEQLGKECGESQMSEGLVIEEITEEESEPLPSNYKEGSSFAGYPVIESEDLGESQDQCRSSRKGSGIQGTDAEAECLKNLQGNPEAMRTFHHMISNADPETLATLSGSGISPVMIKTMSDMVKRMSPEELQKMIEVASSLNGKNTLFENTMNMNGQRTSTGSVPSEIEKHEGGESTTRDFSQTSRASTSSVSVPSTTGDMQEQIRNQMKDPAMRQMFGSMVKNMSPEMMTSMGEQFGFKISREDALKAQQAMSSLSPEDLDKMMRWAEKLQKATDCAKTTKNWLLGRPGLILALCILILAIILHWMGFIGG